MNKPIKKCIKAILPPFITTTLRNAKSDNVKWSGDFGSWDQASSLSKGYDSNNIIQKVLNSTLEVIKGNAAYERDSVLFHDKELNFQLLSALFFAKNKHPELSVVDFGGALGSLYFQHKHVLNPLKYKWDIIEQKQFLDIGKIHIKDPDLKFKNHLRETEPAHSFLLLSSVLQYLSKPYDFLDEVLSMDYPYIFIDRTGINLLPTDRLTVQEVPKSIYEASYPCWFFSEEKLLSKLSSKYQLLFEFVNKDQANIPSSYKGYFFELRV